MTYFPTFNRSVAHRNRCCNAWLLRDPAHTRFRHAADTHNCQVARHQDRTAPKHSRECGRPGAQHHWRIDWAGLGVVLHPWVIIATTFSGMDSLTWWSPCRILLLQCRITACLFLVRPLPPSHIVPSFDLPLPRAVELANSIFQLRFTKMYRFHASSVAKATAALVPAAQMVLLRFSAVHKSTVGYMALADAISTLFSSQCVPLRSLVARHSANGIRLDSDRLLRGR